jgi:hypothetical protein
MYSLRWRRFWWTPVPGVGYACAARSRWYGWDIIYRDHFGKVRKTRESFAYLVPRTS